MRRSKRSRRSRLDPAPRGRLEGRSPAHTSHVRDIAYPNPSGKRGPNFRPTSARTADSPGPSAATGLHCLLDPLDDGELGARSLEATQLLNSSRARHVDLDEFLANQIEADEREAHFPQTW